MLQDYVSAEESPDNGLNPFLSLESKMACTLDLGVTISTEFSSEIIAKWFTWTWGSTASLKFGFEDKEDWRGEKM
jgi:hypothetical protein